MLDIIEISVSNLFLYLSLNPIIFFPLQKQRKFNQSRLGNLILFSYSIHQIFLQIALFDLFLLFISRLGCYS